MSRYQTGFALLLWGLGSSLGLPLFQYAYAAPLQYQTGISNLRPTVFVEDSAWDVMDRTQVLPSQTRHLGKGKVTDPRDYLLRHKLQPSKTKKNALTAAHNLSGKALVENVIQNEFLPSFNKLLQADLGATQFSPQKQEYRFKAPIPFVQTLIMAAVAQLAKTISTIESEMAPKQGARHLTYLIAPWRKNNPVQELNARFAPSQLGFNSKTRTPEKDIAGKHWLHGVSSGRLGSLGLVFQEVASKSSAIVFEENWNEKNHQKPPYVYPLGFLVHLKLERGKSIAKIQALFGLQPLRMPLEPRVKENEALIDHAGIAQALSLDSSLSAPNSGELFFPMMLATFSHPLREKLDRVRINIEFGTWDEYHPFLRRFQLSSSRDSQSKRLKKAWRLAPYIGGTAFVGKSKSYLTHLKIPMRIHITGFDVLSDKSFEEVQISKLVTAVDLYDHKAGAYLPVGTGFHFGVTHGSVPQKAANEIQAEANRMIAQALEKAKNQSRDQAQKNFPLSFLFAEK